VAKGLRSQGGGEGRRGGKPPFSLGEKSIGPVERCRRTNIGKGKLLPLPLQGKRKRRKPYILLFVAGRNRLEKEILNLPPSPAAGGKDAVIGGWHERGKEKSLNRIISGWTGASGLPFPRVLGPKRNVNTGELRKGGEY